MPKLVLSELWRIRVTPMCNSHDRRIALTFRSDPAKIDEGNRNQQEDGAHIHKGRLSDKTILRIVQIGVRVNQRSAELKIALNESTRTRT